MRSLLPSEVQNLWLRPISQGRLLRRRAGMLLAQPSLIAFTLFKLICLICQTPISIARLIAST